MDLQQMQDATPAPEPGARPEKLPETTEGKVNVGISRVASAGYVWIYHNETFEPSKCNRNMLPRKLAEKFPAEHKMAGEYVWGLKQKGEPFRGTYKCLLHPDGEKREHYNNLGLVTCRKSNMNSPFQVQQHMEHKHPVEWKIIEQERKDAEKQEDRDFQRGIMNALVKGSDNGSRSIGQDDERSDGAGGEAQSRRQERPRYTKQG